MTLRHPSLPSVAVQRSLEHLQAELSPIIGASTKQVVSGFRLLLEHQEQHQSHQREPQVIVERRRYRQIQRIRSHLDAMYRVVAQSDRDVHAALGTKFQVLLTDADHIVNEAYETLRPRRGRPPDTDRDIAVDEVARVLAGAKIPLTKSRDGVFAKTIVVVLRVLGHSIPTDLFEVVSGAIERTDDRSVE